MDYRYLKTFILTARHSSFTQAAEELHIAQSAVSRQIRLLEESIGAQLLIRSPQKVLLTAAGEELYKQAGSFDRWYDEFFHKESPTLRIGVLPGILENYLLKKLLQFPHSELPNLKIETASAGKITRLLEDGGIDIAFQSQKIEDESIHSRKILAEEFLLISKKKVNINRLHEQRWIYSEKGSYLKKLSKKRSSCFIQVDSISALLSMVEAGAGVAIVASHMISKKHKLHKTPMDKLKGEIYMSMPKYHVMPEYLQSFVERVL